MVDIFKTSIIDGDIDHVAHNYSGHLHMCQPIKTFFPPHSWALWWMWVHLTVTLIEVIAVEGVKKAV